MSINRRTLIATAAMSTLGMPAFAQAKTKLKVGYLHTPAVDSHIWIGQQLGAFDKQGLE